MEIRKELVFKTKDGVESLTKSTELLRILVAEDEIDMLDSYKEILDRDNYEVFTAQDGVECLDIYREELQLRKSKIGDDAVALPFEVVVLDYKMPRKNGLQTAEEILSLNPHQRIIFASAYLEGAVLESAKQLGRIIEVIKKPFPLSKLIDLIENKEIFQQLEKLNVNIHNLKQIKPNQESMKIYLEALKILEKRITN